MDELKAFAKTAAGIKAAMWYVFFYHKVVKYYASLYGVDEKTVAGVIAAFSPQKAWRENLAIAREYLSGNGQTGYFKHQLRKVHLILSGWHPLEALKGDKERAFALALAGDYNAAVIDIHMIRALKRLFPELPEIKRGKLTPNNYVLYVAALQNVAHELDMPVAHAQSLIWVWERGALA